MYDGYACCTRLTLSLCMFAPLMIMRSPRAAVAALAALALVAARAALVALVALVALALVAARAALAAVAALAALAALAARVCARDCSVNVLAVVRSTSRCLQTVRSRYVVH